MRNAIDEQGHQIHIMSAVGHQTKDLLELSIGGTLTPASGKARL